MTRPTTASLLAATLALAAFTPSSAWADCPEDLEAAWTRNADVRSHLEDADQRNMRLLRRSARFLTSVGQDEACEETVEALSDLFEERRAKLVDRGVILSRSEQQQRERYRDATPLGTGGATIAAASRLIGADVRNPAGKKLGDVDDLLVDAGATKDSYLVVERGGFLGMGREVVAVPTDRLAVTSDFETILLDMTEDRFDEAPQLVSRELLLDPEWRRRNAAFFDQNP